MTSTLLPAKGVRAEFGGVSNMTLHRWLADESLGFPRPIVIRNRRYFDAAEVASFKQRMAEAGVARHTS